MKQFTLEERKMLSKFLREGRTYEEIGLIIRKSKSSISDEIKRNSEGKESYDPYEAQRRAELRQLQKRRRRKLEISPGIKRYVTEKIREDWSPEEIAGELKENAKGKTIICHETIYQFIYSKEGKEEKLWKHMRHKKQAHRKAWGSRKKREIIPNRVSIHKRPWVVNQRRRFGDYEGDLMIFSNTSKVLAVFVERTTRKVFAIVNENKTAEEMKYAMHEMICSAGIHWVKSITFDNGGENVCHEEIRKDYSYQIDTYFCDPYCSWQKGTVENTNKLLRQYLPRDISPELLTQKYIDYVVKKLNSRPRKCLNYKTPDFMFYSCSV